MANEDAQHLQTGQRDKAAPQQTEEEVHKTSGGENKRKAPRSIKTVTGVGWVFVDTRTQFVVMPMARKAIWPGCVETRQTANTQSMTS